MESIGRRFVQALAAKDDDAMRGLLADDVDFKGLTPGRLWEGATPADVLDAVLGHWFAPEDHVTDVVHATDGEPVVDLDSLRYRVLVTNGDGDHVVEQQGYYRVRDDRISYLRLICSGYRPLR